MEGNTIPKRVLYMNLESTRPKGRPRNRWQDDAREDDGIVGGEVWQEKVYNREEWKKFLRMARNCRIVHKAVGWMDFKIRPTYLIHQAPELKYQRSCSQICNSCSWVVSLMSARTASSTQLVAGKLGPKALEGGKLGPKALEGDKLGPKAL
jgi:hypothetical protein